MIPDAPSHSTCVPCMVRELCEPPCAFSSLRAQLYHSWTLSLFTPPYFHRTPLGLGIPELTHPMSVFSLSETIELGD